MVVESKVRFPLIQYRGGKSASALSSRIGLAQSCIVTFCMPTFSVILRDTGARQYPDSTMAPNDNFIQRAVNNGVATAGGYAGGVVDAAGKSVSGAGRNVGNR